ncbi:hypothetical protein BS47DRAFT_1367147 [Hydnum rufescens UP504]|uniref:Uncharacterized protein n=1 Tax=Hydnum rufescens UP504 TaxID=1448309 RepID=A0A9P6AJY5_9AGAM|nr:hypothetical protein BS47DRAFT_1367147 [Hydnum rufescens UP504]
MAYSKAADEKWPNNKGPDSECPNGYMPTENTPNEHAINNENMGIDWPREPHPIEVGVRFYIKTSPEPGPTNNNLQQETPTKTRPMSPPPLPDNISQTKHSQTTTCQMGPHHTRIAKQDPTEQTPPHEKLNEPHTRCGGCVVLYKVSYPLNHTLKARHTTPSLPLHINHVMTPATNSTCKESRTNNLRSERLEDAGNPCTTHRHQWVCGDFQEPTPTTP